MKRCLIILTIFCSLFNRVYGQSPSAAIDSLIKYKIITAKDRPEIEKELKNKYGYSYQVAILGGLESILLQKTYHIDPHTSMMFISYKDEHPNKKRQDSINTVLRPLLEQINKAGLLTDRVYKSTLKGIDSGHYMADIQLIGHLTEMRARLERLAPNKLLPVAHDLRKNGIVSDSSFLRLENDIKNGKIESAFQLNNYCKFDRVLDLEKYPDDPHVWLEQIHRDIASIVPGLDFTDFSYTTIPDTSFTLPGVRFRVSLVCNGHIYKHTSLAFNNFKSRQEEIKPKDIFIEDFYRIFNKVLTDQHSPFRLHDIMFGSGTTTDNPFRHFALIALTGRQAEVFMKKPNYSFMSVSMDDYDNTLTSGRIDSAMAGWRSIGLFAHLSDSQISKAVDNTEADYLFSINRLLYNFPGVVYTLDSLMMEPKDPYITLLNHLSTISHGAFDPTNITQSKVNGRIKLQYLSKGKIHIYTFRTENWWDAGFPAFIKNLSEENNLPGGFYPLKYENALIYLTKQQHDYAVKYNLVDLGKQ